MKNKSKKKSTPWEKEVKIFKKMSYREVWEFLDLYRQDFKKLQNTFPELYKEYLEVMKDFEPQPPTPIGFCLAILAYWLALESPNYRTLKIHDIFKASASLVPSYREWEGWAEACSHVDFVGKEIGYLFLESPESCFYQKLSINGRNDDKEDI